MDVLKVANHSNGPSPKPNHRLYPYKNSLNLFNTHNFSNSNMKNPESIKEILEHHFNGGKFEYQSFDFKKAAAEYEQTDEWKQIQKSSAFFNQTVNLKDKYQIPEEIRDKYIVWRIGKLRSIEFGPTGKPFRIRLGAKYAISFYEYKPDLAKIRLI